MNATEGPDEEVTTSAAPGSVVGKVLESAWREVAAVQRKMLETITFDQLVDRARHQAENMYYISRGNVECLNSNVERNPNDEWQAPTRQHGSRRLHFVICILVI